MSTSTNAAAGDQAHVTQERLKEAGDRVGDRLRSEADTRLEGGRRSAAETASDAAGALDSAAATLEAEGHDTLAQATFMLADKLSQLGRYVEDHSVSELSREARKIARQNPALFVAGGAALGLALSRFMKASPVPEDRAASGADDGAPLSGNASSRYPYTSSDSETGDLP